MNDVTIFYGPKTKFKDLLPDNIELTTLTQLALLDDAKRRELTLNGQDESINEENRLICLVAYSDEYSSIAEHAIQGFVSFVSRYNIEHAFLQNPPLVIYQQLEKLGVNVNVIRYQYKCIDGTVYSGPQKLNN